MEQKKKITIEANLCKYCKYWDETYLNSVYILKDYGLCSKHIALTHSNNYCLEGVEVNEQESTKNFSQ